MSSPWTAPVVAVVLLALASCGDPVAAPTPVARAEFTRAPETLVAPGTRFDTLVVAFRGPADQPAAGVRVTWNGDGVIVPFDTVTREDGTARVQWTLPRFREPDVFNPGIGNGPSGRYRLHANSDGGLTTTATTAARSFAVDSVSAAYSIACGMRGEEVWCWGPSLAALIPAYPASPRPQRITVPGRPVSVTATDESLCVRDAEGAVRCASPETGKQFTPIGGLPPIAAMAAFNRAWCALAAADGTVWCWDLAAGTTAAPIGGMGGLVTISAGNRFWCGRRGDGTAVCWGDNSAGSLGDGTTVTRPTPTPVLGLAPTMTVAAGYRGACALTVTGEAWCWGIALAGGSTTPVRLELGEPVAQLWVADETLLLRMSGGTLRLFDFGVERSTEYVRNLSSFTVRAVSGRDELCITTMAGEVVCSIYLTYGGNDSRVGPSELLPVPIPAP